MSTRNDEHAAQHAAGNAEPGGRRVVAVIGIDRYRHWQPLSNAKHDALGALALFQRLGFELFAEPLMDDGATGNAIHSLVADELRELHPEDSLVLFYAGHGTTRKNRLHSKEVKVGYLIPVDASRSPERVSSWIDLEAWLRAISLLPAKHILVILDACHSGVALDPIIKWRDIKSQQASSMSTLMTRQSRRIITSALDDQVALDSGPVYGHSLFTGCLIEALTDGLPRNGRRMTTGSELGLYLQHRVQTYPGSSQTPDFGTFAFDERGEMPIPLDADPRACEAPEVAGGAPPVAPAARMPSHGDGLAESHGTPGLRFPLRRSILLGGAAMGSFALAATAWLWRHRTVYGGDWTAEHQLLSKAIARLGPRLAQAQDSGGGFKGYYLNRRAYAYDTGQELTCLMAAVQVNPRVFDAERRSRALGALDTLSGELQNCQASLPTTATVGLCWTMIAASRYIQTEGSSDAQRIIIRNRQALLERQLKDGAFEYACDAINKGHASAYATAMAVWACCEIEQADASTDELRSARRAAVTWLTRQFLSLPTMHATAIASVRGLAEQTFWILERARHLDNRGHRSDLQNKVADLIAKQIFRDCTPDDDHPCSSPDGKIVNGLQTTDEYKMFWLPWATLAALELLRSPPSSPYFDVRDMESATRLLIRELSAREAMSVSVTQFEPAEHLFAMSEALARLPA